MRVHKSQDDNYWGTAPEAPWAGAVAAAGAATGLRTSIFALRDATDDTTPMAVMVEYPPNYPLPRHSHGSGRLELVVRGSIQVGEDVLGPGDIMTADADELYGPHTIGPEGCTTMEVASVRGGRLLTFDTPQGPMNVDFSNPESLAP